MKEKLNLVDEQGDIIGEESREKIHREGLLHREIHVWLFNKKGEILFQLRGPHQDTYPNLLDATVGGHVDIGEDFISAAIRELKEEIGIRANRKNLIFLGNFKSKNYDKVTKNTNNAIKKIYAYQFDGTPNELKLEDGKVINLESWSIEKLNKLTEEERKKFIPVFFFKEYFSFFQKIKQILEGEK